MKMDITDLTRNIGTVLAKIKNNNKLIDELNKVYNPTFLEIMEDLQKSDQTLATLLMVWYTGKYSSNTTSLEKVMNDIRKAYGIKDPIKKEYVYSSSSSCGNNGGSIGCGVTPKKSSGGC